MLNCNLYVFSASLLQSSVSHDLQKSSQETFLIIINVENSRTAQYFCGNCDIFNFSGFTDEQTVQRLFEIEIFCNIINVFTNTCHQCNATMQNKSMIFC